MHIGVLTHNYPRFIGDFSGNFIEALCEELVVQGQRVTAWTPHDAAFARPLDAPVQIRPYRYVWPERLHLLGYSRSMESDLALRLNTYALSPLMFGAGIATVMREAKATKPDVLHAHWLLPNGFIAAVVSKRLGIPLVISVPGSDAQVARANPLFRRMARFAMQQADLMTANSAALRDAVLEIEPEAARNFDLIIYGTDPAKLRPDSTGVSGLKAILGIGNQADIGVADGRDVGQPLVILCVGRMVYKKGFDILLRALGEERLAGRNVVAILVGEGDQLAEWQALAAQLGVADRVRWVGNVPTNEIGLYYNTADVLINPAVSNPADGLNVTVLDAMSCGKPVIGSNVAGNPLAIRDGETGFIVPEQDPAALADRLARLADDAALRIRMGAVSRARIEQELGWPHLARRYLDHFEKIRRDAR